VISTVEWVETTGKTIEEAKESALDQLGVDAEDAEFEVIEEPRSGLFGRTRGLGRVRARVVPRTPRPKPERRRRGKGSDRSGGNGRNAGAATSDAADGGTGTSGSAGKEKSTPRVKETRESGDGRGQRSGGGDRGRRPARKVDDERSDDRPAKEREVMDPTEQCTTIEEFVTGLSEAFGLATTVTTELDDDDILRVEVDGSEVGLLIGPRLGTLDAIQEICRNVLQRQADGREHGKVVVDVSNVREMRRSALAAFVTDAAQKVKDEGTDVVFEVMSSADRKVVHDTVAEIDGVESGSVGEDPRRRVVVRPA
jgi:spoIIIJ-associated protein